MRTRAKVDGSHAAIVQAFRQCGWQVLSLARLGYGAPDLLVSPHAWSFARGFRQGECAMYLIEVKNEKGRHRAQQVKFAETWPVHTLRSVEDAMRFIQDR